MNFCIGAYAVFTVACIAVLVYCMKNAEEIPDDLDMDDFNYE